MSKFLLIEKNLSTGVSKEFFIFTAEQSDVNSLKKQFRIMNKIDANLLFVKKVTDEDVFEINLNRYLRNKKEIQIFSHNDVLIAFVKGYSGEDIGRIDKTILEDAYLDKRFDEAVKDSRDESGIVNVKELVKKSLYKNPKK